MSLYAQSHKYSSAISSRFVTSFQEDTNGYIWMGTMRGLCRYDGKSYLTFNASSAEGGLDNDFINDLCMDSYGYIWVATNSGLVCYADGVFKNVNKDNTQTNPVVAISMLDGNHIVASGENGIVRFCISEDGDAIYESAYQDKKSSWAKKMVVSSQQDIWFAYTDGNDVRLTVLDRDLNLIEEIILPLPNTAIQSLIAGVNNSVWISTSNGMFAFDEMSREPTPIPETIQSTIGNRWIYFVAHYTDNAILIGSSAGMYVYDFRNKSLTGIYPEITLDAPYYRCMVDSDKNIWLSDNISDPICLSGQRNYTHVTLNEGNSEYIKNMTMDQTGKLHLSTEIVYYTYDPVTGTTNQDLYCRGAFTNQMIDSKGIMWLLSGQNYVRRYSTMGGKVQEISPVYFQGDVLYLFEDQASNVWALLANNMLEYITAGGEHGVLLCPNPSEIPSIVYSPIIDNCSKKVFISSSDGSVYECSTSGLTKHGFPISSLSTILSASDGTFWLGTFNKGLVHYDPISKKAEYFTDKDNILENDIKAILEDSNGDVWFSTAKHVTRYSKTDGKFTSIYDNSFSTDGFYELGCALVGTDGRLYFGGNGGYTILDPSDVPPYQSKNLVLRMEEIGVNGEDYAVIPESLKLNHNQNNISFRFVALDFTPGTITSYAYKLEGVDRDWNYTTDNTAFYNNLSAGKYTFVVRYKGTDGSFTLDELRYDFRIMHSVWGSLAAKCIYLILITLFAWSVVLGLTRMRVQNERLALAQKKEELQQGQLDFLTNISHEFRTPLALIYGPLKLLMRKDYIKEDDKSSLIMMEKNISRLIGLSEKLLSASLEKTSDRVLKVASHSPVRLLDSLSESFRFAASQKSIEFKTDSSNAEGQIYYDEEKIEKILYNILSNAFKYTPQNGSVSLSYNNDGKDAIFIVTDNGRGIAEDKVPHIFDRFDRLGAEKTEVVGSGIGLHYSMNLAQVHKGTITYSPNPEGGSIFTLKFPCHKEAYSDYDLSEAGTIKLGEPEVTEPSVSGQKSTKPNLVLVEDNEDVRVFLRSLLSPSYNITTCSDGEEGLDKIKTTIPDLVVSDVMMPRKDGFELCSDLKSDPFLCHIPVVLLTAKADISSTVKGLKGGAEAYIPKPFDPDQLIATIESLLDNRRRIQSHILNLTPDQLQNISSVSLEEQKDSNKEEHNANEVVLSPRDKIFLEKVQAAIEKNLDDSSFTVETLASEINVSYSSLYAHMKTLVGDSPQAYLSVYRLNKARTLIQSGKYTISEVSYLVGASSQSNFARSYKKQFGITPSDELKQHFG